MYDHSLNVFLNQQKRFYNFFVDDYLEVKKEQPDNKDINRNKYKEFCMQKSVKMNSSLTRVQVAKAFIFAAAGLSLLMSVYLYFLADKQAGIFVGIWVPSILSAGALMLISGEKND